MVHSCDVTPRRQFSDSLNDVCLVSCSICRKISSRPQFYTHLAKFHGELESIPSNPFKYAKLTYHECKICAKHILLDTMAISDHVRKEHSMAWKDYKVSFIKDIPEKKRTVESAVVDGGTWHDIGKIKRLKPNNEPAAVAVIEIPDDDDVGGECIPWEESIAKKSEDSEEERYVTDNVHEMSLAQCVLCSKITLLHHIQVHLYNAHGIVYKDDAERKRMRFSIVRETYHRCRLCSKLMLFSFHPLYIHLRDEHSISLTQYKRMYLGYNKDNYVYQKRPHVIKNCQQQQQQSAITNGSSTADSPVVAQDPTLKSTDSAVESPREESVLNVSALMDSPPRSSSVSSESAHADNEAISSPDVTLPSNSSSNSPEVITLGVSNDNLDLGCILEKVDEAKEDEKTSKSSADRKPSQNQLNTSDMTSTPINELSYVCPIPGCGHTVKEAELVSGRAARHMHKVHSLRPYKMKVLKLFWQRKK
eukprot:TRINITY_DN5183_c0_g1_i2.p1 TRINITY_DN5183_c0_g1~~TRINITY_DN5183_c0_g1_i2.p1  ORF type:complete len:476 (+),score=93.54 TRINITY_DN5183_c0_g1_i2:910-2337(+)